MWLEQSALYAAVRRTVASLLLVSFNATLDRVPPTSQVARTTPLRATTHGPALEGAVLAHELRRLARRLEEGIPNDSIAMHHPEPGRGPQRDMVAPRASARHARPATRGNGRGARATPTGPRRRGGDSA